MRLAIRRAFNGEMRRSFSPCMINVGCRIVCSRRRLRRREDTHRDTPRCGGARWDDCRVAPLPVEITNQTDWWQAYTPPLVGLLSSLVVAAAAFWGVIVSNRTNVLAIDAADKRERDTWRRETVLRLSSDALTAVLAIEHQYQSVGDADATDFAVITTATQRIGAIADNLSIIGSTDLAELCKRMEGAAASVETPWRNLREAHEIVENAETDRSPGGFKKWFELKVRVTSEPESRYAEALAHLATVRGLFIDKSRGELNPTAASEG
jgi:hypothetical protein